MFTDEQVKQLKSIVKESVDEVIAPFALSVKEQFDHIDDRFDGLEKRMDNLEVKVDNLEVRFDNLEVRFDNLEVKVDNLKVKVDKLDNRVGKLESGMVTKDYLDEKIADLKGDLIVKGRQESQRTDKIVQVLSENKLLNTKQANELADLKAYNY